MLAVTIRTAVPGDLDALRGVFRRASLSNPDDRPALLAHPEVLVWPADAIAEGRTRVAVDPAGVIVGFATTVVDGETLELEDLFVEPARMRQQVGRHLVRDMLDAARRRGFRTVRVDANQQALAFYAAVGFVPDGTAQTRFGPVPRLRGTVPQDTPGVTPGDPAPTV